jgi:dihydropteroate synthase
VWIYCLVDFRYLVSCDKPVLMGIVNVTPDSFSDGGSFDTSVALEQNIADLWQAGTHIIDIGAESTRPNSIKIDATTEIERLSILNLPLENHHNHFYSIDTYKARTAEFALKNGFHIVNDVTGLKYDKDMAKIIADYDANVVIMYNHAMNNTKTGNIVTDCFNGLQSSLDIAVQYGINPNKICLDVGIGFGMSPIENMVIINNLGILKTLGFPILVGASRKSFINHFLNIPDPKKRLGATLATHYHAVKNGADIIRIHDVYDHKQFFAIMPHFNVSADGLT